MFHKQYHIADYCRTSLPLAVWDEQHIFRQHARHEHDCIEIMFVYEGAGSCGIGDTLYSLLPGSLYVILEHETHDYSSDFGMHFYNIMFTESLFCSSDEQLLYQSFLARIRQDKVISLAASKRRFMLQLLERLKQEQESHDPLSCFGFKLLFLEFLFCLVRSSTESVPGQPLRRHEVLVSRICEYVERHYQERITLGQLSSHFHLSAAHVSRLFKSGMGMDFSVYLMRFRLEKSKGLLEDTDASLQEIASECGFYDMAYYIRCFKRYYSVTPGVYRTRFHDGH